MLKRILFVLIPVFHLGCLPNKKKDEIIVTPKFHKVTTIISDVNIAQLEEMISNPCDTFSYEFTGLYPTLDTLPDAFSDQFILDKYIKSSGFTVTSSGHGNWEGGPRIMTVALTNGSYQCKIFKKYYYNHTLEGNCYNLRVTEKIVCNADNNAVD